MNWFTRLVTRIRMRCLIKCYKSRMIFGMNSQRAENKSYATICNELKYLRSLNHKQLVKLKNRKPRSSTPSKHTQAPTLARKTTKKQTHWKSLLLASRICICANWPDPLSIHPTMSLLLRNRVTASSSNFPSISLMASKGEKEALCLSRISLAYRRRRLRIHRRSRVKFSLNQKYRLIRYKRRPLKKILLNFLYNFRKMYKLAFSK